jgi:hypothetical protein
VQYKQSRYLSATSPSYKLCAKLLSKETAAIETDFISRNSCEIDCFIVLSSQYKLQHSPLFGDALTEVNAYAAIINEHIVHLAVGLFTWLYAFKLHKCVVQAVACVYKQATAYEYPSE